MKKQLLGLFVTAGLLAACGNGEVNESTNETTDTAFKDTYIIGLDDTFAPMSFRDTDGQIVGFDVDLAEAIGEDIGVSFEFQAIDWTMKETELNTGNIDLIWNGYTITDERKEKVAFSDSYLENKQIIVTLADSDIQTKADLAGKTVSTQQASASQDAIEADESGIIAEFEGGQPVLYATFTDVFNDLDSGRSDAIVVDEVLGRYIMKQKGADNYKVLDDNFGEEEYGVGMRKEDTRLQDAINQGLADLQENGQYQELYQTWFAE